jgi:basic amino acid/polyamine antiporter, APA family
MAIPGMRDSRPDSEPASRPALRRTLGLWQITVSGTGLVIGAGIYVLIGEAAGLAGSEIWLAFLVAAVMTGLTALSYAELTSMFPSASAEYEFARRAFNELTGFVAGWAMLVAFVIAAAAVAIGFGHYLGQFYAVDYRLSAGGLLVVLTFVVLSGIQRSIWLTTGLVVLQVGGLLLVMLAGLPHLGERDLLAGGSTSGVLSAAALVFFAFIGFDDIVTLSDDAADPRWTMPRALLLTLAISTALYVLVAVAAVSLVDGDQLAVTDRPLALVIEQEWGRTAADCMAFIAIAATVNTTLIILTAASRLVYGMARLGGLPIVLANLGPNGRSPRLAAVLVLLVALALAVVGNIELIASATNFTVYVVFIIVNLAVISLRFRQPELRREFRCPGSLWKLPITPVLALVTIVSLLAFVDPAACLMGTALLLVGFAVRFVLDRRQILPASHTAPGGGTSGPA